MAIRVNGTLKSTFPGQFDKQLHSVEWFYNGEWRRIWDTVYPLNDAEILDDTLDCGGFVFINELEPFPDETLKNLKQLTPIRILWDSADDDFDVKQPVEHPIWRYRVVNAINIKQNGRTFKVTVSTIEPTKILELVPCDTMTFTRKLGHEIDMGAIEVGYATAKEDDYDSWIKDGVIAEMGGASSPFKYAKIRLKTKTTFFNPCRVGSKINIPVLIFGHELTGPLGGYTYPYKIRVTLYNSSEAYETELYTYDHHGGEASVGNLAPYSYDIGTAGEYVIRYYPLNQNDSNNNCYVQLSFSAVDAIPNQIDLSITSVLERILSAGKTRREGIDRQMFKLSQTVAEAYNSVQAPEFALTRCTMWEALKTVAGHVHCIPRLIWDEDTNSFDIVTLDKLGGMEECIIRAEYNGNSIAFDHDKTLDSFCGSIETYVDNLVNTRDETAGSIVEPFTTGWLSTRATGDSSVIIEDDNAVFKLSRPNMRISKLEIRYNGKEANITPYLFEAAEYRALSQFEGPYPNSAQYALKYEIGGTEITELKHKVNTLDASGVGVSLRREAIINIAHAVGIELESAKFKNLQYRVTYSPVISTRIVQKKPYLDKLNAFFRVYNMDGNMLESEYVGEHLKGAIARLGNDTEKRTYYFKRAKDIPKPGQLLDGMYIMQVISEIVAREVIHSTLVLSEDYNQKNEYVAIDSNVRFYDVSEKQSVERHVNYCESIIIGDRIASSAAAPLLNKAGMQIFRKVFTGDASNEQISWAWFAGTSKKYGDYTPSPPNKIILPCMSQAMGNCLLFNFACADNYGAGWRIYYDLSRTRAVQTQVPYGNKYGELYKMDLRLGSYEAFDEAKKESLSTQMPLWTYDSAPYSLVGTESAPLIIDKDSREQLNITIQLAMVATRHSIIIGSTLCGNNPLVTENKNRAATCYLLPERINKFDSRIDVRKGVQITENYMPTEVIDNGSCTEFSLPAIENKTQSTAKAIVWVDESDGANNAKLLIGENYEIPVGSTSKQIWFSTVANK